MTCRCLFLRVRVNHSSAKALRYRTLIFRSVFCQSLVYMPCLIDVWRQKNKKTNPEQMTSVLRVYWHNYHNGTLLYTNGYCIEIASANNTGLHFGIAAQRTVVEFGSVEHRWDVTLCRYHNVTVTIVDSSIYLTSLKIIYGIWDEPEFTYLYHVPRD